jgi:hypothetical protein
MRSGPQHTHCHAVHRMNSLTESLSVFQEGEPIFVFNVAGLVW